MNISRSVALGKGVSRSGVGEIEQPKTIEEEVAMMKEKLQALTVAFYATIEKMGNEKSNLSKEDEVFFENTIKNNDNIPIGTVLLGTTKGLNYILIVGDLGEYIVGYKTYPSLSAAAEAVSGVRRSGWTFWKLPDGKTAKEVFRR